MTYTWRQIWNAILVKLKLRDPFKGWKQLGWIDETKGGYFSAMVEDGENK